MEIPSCDPCNSVTDVTMGGFITAGTVPKLWEMGGKHENALERVAVCEKLSVQSRKCWEGGQVV